MGDHKGRPYIYDVFRVYEMASKHLFICSSPSRLKSSNVSSIAGLAATSRRCWISATECEPCLIAAVDWGILSTYLSADLFNLRLGGRDEFFPL